MQTVLFDLDGTLIDHFTAIHSSIAYAQKALGLPVSDYETVRHTVGGSLPVTLGRLMGDKKVETALPYFHEHFDKVMFDEVSILPGAEWLLAALHKKDFQLAVFTNKFGHHARAIVEHLKLDCWLTATVGTQDTPFRKPDPQFTDYILQRLNADPNDTCLIGDSPFDYQAAQIRNIPAYLVATGTHSFNALKTETAASAVFENLFDLGTTRFGLPQSTTI